MRDLLALDARDFAAGNALQPGRRDLSRPRTLEVRSAAAGPRPLRRSGAEASETTTMVVVLVAWAMISGYLFAHVAEGAVMAATASHVAAAAPHVASRA